MEEEEEDPEEEGLAAHSEAPNPAEDPQGYEAFMGEQQLGSHQGQEADCQRGEVATATGEDEPQVLPDFILQTASKMLAGSNPLLRSVCHVGRRLSQWTRLQR